MEGRDMGQPQDFDRREFGPPMDRRDIGPDPMMDRPGPPMDRRDMPMDRRDFGPRGPEMAGRGHPGLIGDTRGLLRPDMLHRSPRMEEPGMDMGPRMRPPMDPRSDLGRGGPMGPRPNMGPGLGRGVRPEGEMGPMGPRMDMGPSGPRMDLGPRGPGPMPEIRDPRQAAADPRRMASASAGQRPPGPVSTSAGTASPPSQDQEKAALIMQVLQLSDDQIAMLPEDQRQSIMILKEQLARGAS